MNTPIKKPARKMSPATQELFALLSGKCSSREDYTRLFSETDRLVSLGADINAKGPRGLTPFAAFLESLAKSSIISGRQEYMDHLVSLGANPLLSNLPRLVKRLDHVSVNTTPFSILSALVKEDKGGQLKSASGGNLFHELQDFPHSILFCLVMAEGYLFQFGDVANKWMRERDDKDRAPLHLIWGQEEPPPRWMASKDGKKIKKAAGANLAWAITCECEGWKALDIEDGSGQTVADLIMRRMDQGAEFDRNDDKSEALMSRLISIRDAQALREGTPRIKEAGTSRRRV